MRSSKFVGSSDEFFGSLGIDPEGHRDQHGTVFRVSLDADLRSSPVDGSQ